MISFNCFQFVMVYKLPSSASSHNVAKNNSFWTDANGRQYLKRTINQRESYNVSQKDFDGEFASANYYPITSGISIDGRSPDEWMDVLIDRAQGAASLKSDEIEIMVHRRLKHDDGRGERISLCFMHNTCTELKFLLKGVGESLDEQQFGKGLVARGKHHVRLGKSTDSKPPCPNLPA